MKAAPAWSVGKNKNQYFDIIDPSTAAYQGDNNAPRRHKYIAYISKHNLYI